MALRNLKGYTLVEVLVASSIAVILALLATSLFVAANRLLGTSNTSHMLSRDFSIGLDTLRSDLKETALGSIRLQSGDNPGASFVTPYNVDGVAQLDSLGAPRWQGWFHYTLDGPSTSPTANLVRWMEPREIAIPVATSVASFPIPKTTTGKVVLRDVVRPGASLPDLGGKTLQVGQDDGFSVRFLRMSGGKLVPALIGPAELSTQGKNPSGNTRLVEVALRTYDKGQTRAADCIGLRFRVAPRYGF